MKLRRVEIVGFKSFGRKVSLDFPEGLTAIVGPNGSGKSNVIDAICFGLGYPSRNIRAGNTKDLIHKGKISVPDAKVLLHFKKDAESMDVMRKVNRKGQSTYKLNNMTVGRDGIHDVLGKHSIPKNGYNIVMQNDVMRFVQIKPAERRKFLDEVSGISGYEDKKKRSIDELAIVERRISDTDLILSEKKGYLHEIGKDREMAMKYQGMQDTLKKDKSVYYYKLKRDAEGELESVSVREAEIVRDKEVKIVELARLDEEVDGIDSRLGDITKEIIQSAGGETGQIRGEMGALKSAIERKQEEIEFLKGEIGELEGKKKLNEASEKGIREQIAGSEKSLKERSIEITKIASEIANEELVREKKAKEFNNSELVALDSKRKALSESLFDEKQALAILEKEFESLKSREDELGKITLRKKTSLKEFEEELVSKEKELGKLGLEAERISKLIAERDSGREKLSVLYQNFARAESEIKTIEQMEAKLGESEALKFVKSKKEKGYIGQVRDLGDVPEKYREALAIAAGNKAKCLVVNDDSTAQFYIEGLRKERIGRATFLPLNKVSGPVVKAIKGDGVLGYARDLVKCDKKYQKVFDFVFGETIVVKDIDTARRLGIGKFKMVTLDGDFMARGGAMTGGFARKSTISFSSVKEKQKKLDEMAREIATLKDSVDILERKLVGRTSVNVELAKERRGNLTKKIEELQTEISLAETEASSLIESKKEFDGKIKISRGVVKEAQKDLDKVEGKMNMGAFEGMKNALDEMDSVIKLLREKKFEIASKESEIKSEINSFNERIKSLHESIDSTNSQISKYKTKIQDNLDSITTSGEGLLALEEKHKIVNSATQKHMAEQQRLGALVKEFGEKKGGLDAILERLREESNKLEIKKARAQARLDEVREGLEGMEAFPEPGPEELKTADLPELKSRIKAIERELGAIDGVNLRAVDMYEELKRQYEEIRERNEKLRGEKGKILELISAIEEKKKIAFFETFYKVRDSFEEIMPLLYPGSPGAVYLDDEKNPFSSGLGIKVWPRGRDGVKIDSLSGGEKALTAIAFLMALQNVNPSPFYILDEVDAPLDAPNSLRLVNFLKNQGTSQYIMISHNPETVKHVDAIMGVHMQDGLSKIVGVDMKSIKSR